MYIFRLIKIKKKILRNLIWNKYGSAKDKTNIAKILDKDNGRLRKFGANTIKNSAKDKNNFIIISDIDFLVNLILSACGNYYSYHSNIYSHKDSFNLETCEFGFTLLRKAWELHAT